MRKILSSLVIAVLLGWPGAVHAGDLQTGVAAYQAGDYATALRDFRKAADQGLADAQYNLGNMYATGRGVTQDYAEAVKWYRLAADQGNASAQYNPGGVYYTGLGVTQDYVMAHMWFNIAAASGDADAANRRDLAAKQMARAEIAEAQKMAREWVAKHRSQ